MSEYVCLYVGISRTMPNAIESFSWISQWPSIGDHCLSMHSNNIIKYIVYDVRLKIGNGFVTFNTAYI